MAGLGVGLGTIGSPFNGPALITNEASIEVAQDTMFAFATKQADTAAGYIVQLGNASAGLAPPTIEPQFPTGPAAPGITLLDAPTVDEVTWVAPGLPPQFTAELDLGDIVFDPLTDTAPILAFPDAPTFNEEAPVAPDVDLSFEMPTLDLTLPSPPSLISVSVSPFGGVNMPTFDAEMPELNLVAPAIREYIPGKQYTSELLTTLKGSLQDRIANGGSGLGHDAETAIWERGKEREFRSQADAIGQLEQMEGLGYMLPPGIYLDARLKITTETDYAARGHSREVMVESARLELDNVKHALTTATALEGQCMSYANQVEQRMFDSMRYATEAGVSIYNAQVQAFAARVDVYRAQVNVFEGLIRAEMAKVETYKATIEAEQVKASINTALVDQYKAQIQGALANVEVFKARIEGVTARANLEQAKISIFGEQVKAYGTRVNAYSAGVEAFRARIQGETAKQQAYTARVDAFRSTVEAQGKVIDARVNAYRGQIEGYTARVDQYKAAVAGETARVQGLTSIAGARADIYKAQVQGVASYNEVLTKEWQVALDQAQRTAEIGIQAAKANADLYISTRSLALDAAKVGAQVSAQLGASALSALNLSMSYSQSRSDGTNNGYSMSDSNSLSNTSSFSNSTSTATNYNYSA